MKSKVIRIALFVACLTLPVQSVGQNSKTNGFEKNVQSFDNDTLMPKLINFSERIQSIVVSNNKVYVGGRFANVDGNTSANFVAVWNGTQWSPIGEGLNARVFSLAVKGDTVYAGGQFTAAGGDPKANYIAMWDGQKWKAVGDGIDAGAAIVYKVQLVGNDLYVGGVFSNMGNNANARNIARFDGTAWHGLKNGVDASSQGVPAIAAYKNGVLIGGEFANIDGDTDMSRIAYWDGENWQSVGKGVNGLVRAITVVENDIYVGGAFTQSGDVSTKYISKWNGTEWSSLGNGLTGLVNTILEKDGHIWVGGSFSNVDENEFADNLVRWDQEKWNSVENGLNDEVTALTFADDYLLIGGRFYTLLGQAPFGYVEHSSFTYYNLKGYYWKSFLPSLNGPVNKVMETPQGLMVAGAFTNAGDNPDADRIALWNGSTWEAVGNGLSSYINDFTFKGDTLMIIGDFMDAGGVPEADKVAMLINNEWKALDHGFQSGELYSVEVVENTVYIGGSFGSLNGDKSMSNISMWKGDVFMPVGAGLDIQVNKLKNYDGILYVTGDFIRTVDQQIRLYHYAKWDGTSWSSVIENEFPVGSSLSDFIITDSLTYIVGRKVLYRIKNGIIDSLGGVFDDFIYSVSTYDNTLLITGRFTSNSSTKNLNRIATYDGKQWRSFGSGIKQNGVGGSYKYGDDYLFYGSYFDAGGNPNADYLAIWAKNNFPILTSNEYVEAVPINHQLDQNYPNPFNPSTVIPYKVSSFSNVSITIYDYTGRKIRELLHETKSAGEYTFTFNSNGLASGMYLYQIQIGDFIETRKMMLIK